MAALDQEEFRALFAQEAEMRLSQLGRLMLELERNGSDPELIGSIFREVHTLKGAAAVVGFDDVSRVAHALEEHLEELRSGRCPVTADLVDALLIAVDGLTVLVSRAVAGEDQESEAAVFEASVHAALGRFTRGGAAELAAVETTAPTVAMPFESLVVEPVAVEQVAAEPATVAPATVAPATVAPATVAPVTVEPAGAAEAAGVAHDRRTADRGRRSGDGGAVMVPLERLDELIRLVSESASAHLRVGRMLADRLAIEPASVPEFSELSKVLNELQERTMRARMVPVATVMDQLHRVTRDVARAGGKDVRLEVRGEDTELDRGVLQELSDSLLHLVRNAVDHGTETPDEREAAGKPRQATVRLHAMQVGSEVIIAVTDEGRGIDVDKVRNQAGRLGIDASELTDEEALQLVFRSGLSTASFVSDISGRGVGLDVVRSSVEAVRGRIEVRNHPGAGTEFRVVVPITLAVLPCLLVLSGGQRFALALHSVVVARGRNDPDTAHAEGRSVIWVDGRPVGVSSLAAILGIGPTVPAAGKEAGAVVVVAGTTQRHAFEVDELVGQRDVVVKGMSRHLPRLSVIAGASVDPDGSILLVLDPPGLISRSRQTGSSASAAPPTASHQQGAEASVLVVDDALTIRELQRTILERAGYRVRVACDGSEALALLAEEPSDLVLTDVEMPNLDGFALTEAIRSRAGISNTPILILTSRSSDTDRQRGLEAGADGYIVKSAFDESALLAAVQRLLSSRG